MNNYKTIGSYTRPNAKYGVRQHVRPRLLSQLSIRVTEWRQIGKAVIWVLPVLLLLNIMCSSAISSMDHAIHRMSEANQLLETRNVELLAEKAVVASESSVKQLAAEKLGLVEVSEGQVGVFNRQSRTFDY